MLWSLQKSFTKNTESKQYYILTKEKVLFMGGNNLRSFLWHLCIRYATSVKNSWNAPFSYLVRAKDAVGILSFLTWLLAFLILCSLCNIPMCSVWLTVFVNAPAFCYNLFIAYQCFFITANMREWGLVKASSLHFFSRSSLLFWNEQVGWRWNYLEEPPATLIHGQTQWHAQTAFTAFQGRSGTFLLVPPNFPLYGALTTHMVDGESCSKSKPLAKYEGSNWPRFFYETQGVLVRFSRVLQKKNKRTA